MNANFLDTPKNLEIEDLENNPLLPMVTWGMVNPFGPTLSGFGMMVQEDVDGGHLISYSLNPFEQTVALLANYSASDAFDNVVGGCLR